MGQAGRLADGQSHGGEWVAWAKAAGGAVAGTGWSSQFAQEACDVHPLPVLKWHVLFMMSAAPHPPEAAPRLMREVLKAEGGGAGISCYRRRRKSSGH